MTTETATEATTCAKSGAWSERTISSATNEMAAQKITSHFRFLAEMIASNIKATKIHMAVSRG